MLFFCIHGDDGKEWLTEENKRCPTLGLKEGTILMYIRIPFPHRKVRIDTEVGKWKSTVEECWEEAGEGKTSGVREDRVTK